MSQMILDDASREALMSEFRLANEFANLKRELEGIGGDASRNALLRVLQIGKRIREIVLAMGIRQAQEKPAPAPVASRTDLFYPDEGARTKAQRQADNNAAIALLAKIKSGEVVVTDTERAILAKYSGNGGGLTDANGMTGSPYEYYTPKAIAGAAWRLLEEMGFAGGDTLDPSAGTGVFAATRPASAVIHSVELDETSGAINAAINNSATASATISPFESVAANTPDESFDAVITNVPFGDASMRGSNSTLDKRFQKANLQEYFVLRCLQKLKPNGLAAFIVPKSIVSGLSAKERKLRQSASLMAEFVGAYRLPNSVFHTAAADVTTDLIVFRKFSRETAQKIDELLQQNPSVLAESNVLWGDFLAGRYFTGDREKYILGEAGVTRGRFGEVAAVINNDTVSNIAAMIRRFPASHIDWKMLGEAETAPIVYKNGDIIRSNGQILRFQGGEWVALEAGVEEDGQMQQIGAKVQTPLDCINNGIGYADAALWVSHEKKLGRQVSIPVWLLGSITTLDHVAEGARPDWWRAIIAGASVMGIMQDSATGPSKHKDEHPALSALLRQAQSYANKTLPKAPKRIKEGIQCIGHAITKGGFTKWWLGEYESTVAQAPMTPAQLYEQAKYMADDESGYVAIEKIQQSFGGFDPMASDEWCISADGKSVVHANDYYTGTHADFLKLAQEELAICTDSMVREKLIRQHDAAKNRLNRVDVSTMTFNLFTPHVTMRQKLAFLREYVSGDIVLTTDANGREIFDIQTRLPRHASEAETREHKALTRFVRGYLRNQNITTASRSDDIEESPQKEEALLRQIKELADSTKAQFDAWARANDEIQASLSMRLNSSEALVFIEEPDGSPLDIAGLNAFGPGAFKPHPYQYAFVRKSARKFGGVLGFDVGLGKTITALAAVQYVQSIGVKKKTFFVVPNSTLTNWRKEAGKAYLDTTGCLFVGLVDGNGKSKITSEQVLADLSVIRENRHSKIFMTLEAFKMIPLKDETMDAYINYLAMHDDAYLLAEKDAAKKRANIAAQAKTKNVTAVGEKSGAVPFFEDMGADSIVLDEAHNYKNSKLTSSDFKSAKYLADPSKSQRGMDMQAKAWYVRGLSDRNDGVLALTATPVTNSPLEVYSMLTLALGEPHVNAMYGVRGADSFMAAACDVEERVEENIVGEARPVRVFTGLQNAGLLRRLLQTSATIKTAADVKADGLDIAIPESSEIAINVDLGIESMRQLIDAKDEYKAARERINDGDARDDDKLTGSPFHLIRKMTKIINDPELADGAMVFKVKAEGAEAAAKAVAAFNEKNIVEERDHNDPNAAPADVRQRIIKDVETGAVVIRYLITIRASLDENSIKLLSTSYDAQEALLKLLAYGSVELDVNVSPKLAALLENFRLEAGSPRHTGQAKQIIFCDELGLHHKLKIAIANQCGTPSGKIRIINARSVDTAGMQEIQDGYNADGDENKYTVIIANKKAEVGINLQKGTQAIHHFSIGWTPDSIHQRNGRGVRQGNPLEMVSVYHYDASGTFDAYKRQLVGIKADWIGSLMSGDSARIKIDGDMSKADYELLADAVGDAGAMNRIGAEIEARNVRQRQAASRIAQVQFVRIIASQNKWLEQYEGDTEQRGYSTWVTAKIRMLNEAQSSLSRAQERLHAAKTEASIKKNQVAVAELKSALDNQFARLSGLKINSNTGLPFPVSQYEQLSDEDRASAAYQNWQKEVATAKRMKEEAVNGFSVRADDGYDAAELSAYLAGDAELIAGQLVSAGALIESGKRLLVAVRPASLGAGMRALDPGTQKVFELIALSEMVVIARNSSGWDAAVARAVAADEERINNSEGGFAIGGGDLYANFVADVRSRITVPIPSKSMQLGSFVFAPPIFPICLLDGASGGDFVKQVMAEQSPLYKINTENGRWSVLTVLDIRHALNERICTDQAVVDAIKAYAATHGMRASAADFPCIWSGMTMARALQVAGVTKEYLEALPDGAAASKSPEELEGWSLGWFNKQQEFAQVNGIGEALDGLQMQTYLSYSRKIDDGVERWTNLSPSCVYALTRPILEVILGAIKGGMLVNEAAEVGYSDYVNVFLRRHVREFTEFIFSERDGHIELKVGAEAARADLSLSASYCLDSQTWSNAEFLVERALSTKWSEINGAAKSVLAISKIDASGLDIEGALRALRGANGIQSVSIASCDDFKAADKYSAAYHYRANQYILLKTVRGSQMHDKIATAGAAGLQGRSFDNAAKAFRICIMDGEKFSDGKPVASITSLFEHVGLKIEDYKA